MFDLLIIAAIAAAAGVAYVQTRDFVRRRLTYVDAAQTIKAPLLAGLAVTVLSLPVTWLLPWIGVGTSILLGISVGAGVLTGQRDIRKRLTSG